LIEIDDAWFSLCPIPKYHGTLFGGYRGAGKNGYPLMGGQTHETEPKPKPKTPKRKISNPNFKPQILFMAKSDYLSLSLVVLLPQMLTLRGRLMVTIILVTFSQNTHSFTPFIASAMFI
jgi:hypothetical protein